MKALDGLDPSDVNDLTRRAGLAREIIYGAELPADLAAQISDAYRKLVGEYGEQVEAGALRALATSGDEPVDSLTDVPTLLDAGYDVELSNWRGVVAPPRAQRRGP